MSLQLERRCECVDGQADGARRSGASRSPARDADARAAHSLTCVCLLASSLAQVRGDSDCCAQCNLAVPESEARAKGAWYEPSKNKWKLRKKNARKRSLRRAQLAQAGK